MKAMKKTLNQKWCFALTCLASSAVITSLFLNEFAAVEEEEVLTQCRRRRSKIRYVKVPTILNTTCIDNPCLKTKKTNWRMVTFIKSVPGNFVYRDVVRRTWGAIHFVEGARFYNVFIIGRTDKKTQALIDEESKRHGDILQLHIPETYRNVVYKTLAGMQWAIENLAQEDYYSSADDDCIVHMGLLQENVEGFKKMVMQQKWSDYPIICMHMKRVDWGPIRMQLSKYNVSFDEYKWPYYPDFCLGGMYTTTVNVAYQLWNLSRIEKPLSMDDVWITGILREKLGMPWQMVVSVNPAVARHDYVYSVRTIETTRKAMVDDWKKIFPKFRHKEICMCDEKNMIKVEDDSKIIKKPEDSMEFW